MIPLKDMHFRIQMHLSPEQEEKAKQDLMELANRNDRRKPHTRTRIRLLRRNHVDSRSLRMVPRIETRLRSRDEAIEFLQKLKVSQ
jgi:hypothetical protein